MTETSDTGVMPPLWALILAGGSSRRMGSDKAQLSWNGVGATLRLREMLDGICQGVMLSRAVDQELPDGWTEGETIRDRDIAAGPLRGILSACAAHPDRAWLVVACDQPLLSPELFATLVQSRDPAVVATCFLDSDGEYPDPMCAIYEPTFPAAAEPFAAHGRGCPRKVLLNAPAKVLPSPGAVLGDADSPADRLRLASFLGAPVNLTLDYYAILRERIGLATESVTTSAPDLASLWEELRLRHDLPFDRAAFLAARNDEFASWTDTPSEGDRIAFLPPVSGGA